MDWPDASPATGAEDTEGRSSGSLSVGAEDEPSERFTRNYRIVGIDSVTNLPIRRWKACPICGSTAPNANDREQGIDLGSEETGAQLGEGDATRTGATSRVARTPRTFLAARAPGDGKDTA